MGSTARALRRRSGPSESPVKTCSQPYPSSAHSRTPDSDGARLAEVVRGPFDRAQGPGRDAVPVGRQPGRCGQGQLPAINRTRPGGQVRVRTSAVGCRVGAAVAHGDGDVHPIDWVEAVLGVDFQAERISLLTVRGAAQQYRAGVAPDRAPRRPAVQAVNCAAVLGFGGWSSYSSSRRPAPSSVTVAR